MVTKIILKKKLKNGIDRFLCHCRTYWKDQHFLNTRVRNLQHWQFIMECLIHSPRTPYGRKTQMKNIFVTLARLQCLSSKIQHHRLSFTSLFVVKEILLNLQTTKTWAWYVIKTKYVFSLAASNPVKSLNRIELRIPDFNIKVNIFLFYFIPECSTKL